MRQHIDLHQERQGSPAGHKHFPNKRSQRFLGCRGSTGSCPVTVPCLSLHSGAGGWRWVSDEGCCDSFTVTDLLRSGELALPPGGSSRCPVPPYRPWTLNSTCPGKSPRSSQIQYSHPWEFSLSKQGEKDWGRKASGKNIRAEALFSIDYGKCQLHTKVERQE